MYNERLRLSTLKRMHLPAYEIQRLLHYLNTELGIFTFFFNFASSVF